MFILSGLRSGVEFWMLNSSHAYFHRPLSPIPLFRMYLIIVPFPALVFLCFCVHISPPSLPLSLGRMVKQQPPSVQSSILGFLFLLFFSSAGFCICISCLGNDDIYFLSRFERAVISVCLLLSLISWLKRLWLMRNACGESWSCKITSVRPRWQEKGQTEKDWRGHKVLPGEKIRGFGVFLLLESDQKDKRQL